MSFNCICKDPEFPDIRYPADLLDLTIPSHGSDLYGIMYTPQGRGPHPTALILHGFPGSEQNVDLAQILRRGGFNSVVFHYRGSWGSEGDFSFEHVLEDTRAAVEYLMDPINRERYMIDPSKFVLIGHSMGGFAALMTGAEMAEIDRIITIATYNLGAVAKERQRENRDERYAKDTYEMFINCTRPLKGTSPETLLDEIKEKAEEWDLRDLAHRLKGKKLLTIAGSRDDVSHLEIHHNPLMTALRRAGVTTAKDVVMTTSHSFHDKRIALAEAILKWLSSDIPIR